MSDSELPIYCVDSSVIFDIWKVTGQYSKDVHKTLWEKIDDFIQQGRIISSVEVYEELKVEEDEDFKTWLAANKSIFIEIDEDQV